MSGMLLPLLLHHDRLSREGLPLQAAPVDIKQLPGCYEMYMELPGIPLGCIRLELHACLLTIAAEAPEQQHSTGQKGKAPGEEDAIWLLRERPVVLSVTRAFALPDDVRTDKISAALENGILKITLPRTPSPKPGPRNIHISKL